MNYYNEHDPKAAAWLRELIAANLIAPGIVDERSILDVDADELAKYTQCHFFAGIGGWSYALRLAGWPDDQKVWTGSCPCQPFSAAGKGEVDKDERHLWPAFRAAIAKRKPSIIFGEQVASADGRIWLAGVRADLEALGYGFGAADLCAASVGAPHRRQRLFWMANTANRGQRSIGDSATGRRESCGRGVDGGMADSDGGNSSDGEKQCRRQHGQQQENRKPLVAVADSEHDGRWTDQQGRETEKRITDGRSGGMGDTESRGRGECGDASLAGSCGHVERASWSRCESVLCRDGKTRRFESGSFPLAHGVSGRVGLLRGYGNAIVPQVAAEFISACNEIF